MKVQVHLMVVAMALLSSIAPTVHASPAPAALGAENATNQLPAISRFGKLRRHLGEKSSDFIALPTEDAWDLKLTQTASGASSAPSGLYLDFTDPQPEIPVPNPGAHVGYSDYAAPAKPVPLDYSYPSTYTGAIDAAAALAREENSATVAPAVPITGFTGDHATIMHEDDATAWSDGASRDGLSADQFISDPSGLSPRPNVIIPEPNILVLFAVFGAAWLIFPRRASPRQRV